MSWVAKLHQAASRRKAFLYHRKIRMGTVVHEEPTAFMSTFIPINFPAPIHRIWCSLFFFQGQILCRSHPVHHKVKVKVKCTIVEAQRPCTGHMAHRGSRGIALLFHDHDTRRGWGVSVTPRPLFTPGKDPVPILQEAGWAPEPVWTGAEILAPIGFRSPDRPARSQSLYRLSYPAHPFIIQTDRTIFLIIDFCKTFLGSGSNFVLHYILRYFV